MVRLGFGCLGFGAGLELGDDFAHGECAEGEDIVTHSKDQG